MPRVKLRGLNIRRNRAGGKWHVSILATGKPLVSSFSGTREQLNELLGTREVLAAYARLTAPQGPREHKEGTLGDLIRWWKQDPFSKWGEKSKKPYAERTRADYEKVEAWLEGANITEYLVDDFTTADVIDAQELASDEKYARFGDLVVSYLSALFKRAVQKRRMRLNPAVGIDRMFEANHNANRNWHEDEWAWVSKNAPGHLRVPLMIMRHAGPRGKDTHLLTRSNYSKIVVENLGAVDALSFNATKNGEPVIVLVVPELREVLDKQCADLLPNARICRNSIGKNYPTENALRKAWQDFKAGKAFKAALPESSDLTLHGLRVTYAGEIKELGFDDAVVAGAIGDRSPSMGKHYSRHADPLKAARRVYAARTKNR